MHRYQKWRYIRKLNSDLIRFYQIGNTLRVFYFGYLTDEKCQLEEVRETCTKRAWWSRRHGETAHGGYPTVLAQNLKILLCGCAHSVSACKQLLRFRDLSY